MVAGGRLPLAFIGAGLLAFAAGAGWLALEPTLSGLPHLHPRVVAVVHLWLPGFLLSVCFGAAYQLMPVVLGEPLAARAAGLWAHLAAHVAGCAVMVVAFAHGRFEWVGAGGMLIAAGTGVFAVAVARTFRAARRRDAQAWCFPLAAGWLAATVVFGVALAVNRRWPWLPLSAVDLLRAHAHLGLAGFFLTLLQGTTFHLVPMFTMGEARRPRLIWAGVLATQAGLLVLAPGLAWDWRGAVVAGAMILTGGIVCSGLALRATLRTRRRRKLEPGLRAFVLGGWLIGVAALLGLALAVLPAGHAWARGLIAVYGIVIIPGALSLTVLGMLCKITPFLVWMRAYGPRVGKEPVPVATALASPGLERWWLRLHVAGLVLTGAGAAHGCTRPALLGGVALAAGMGLFLANVLRVVAHLRPKGILQ